MIIFNLDTLFDKENMPIHTGGHILPDLLRIPSTILRFENSSPFWLILSHQVDC